MPLMFRRFPGLLLLALAAACTPQPAGPKSLADFPDVSTDAILADIKKLASDEFEGRAPGSKGETLTVQYLSEEFRKAGLEPGNPDGTWVQKVPLVAIKGAPSPLLVQKGGAKKSFKVGDDFIAFSKHVVDEVTIENSELVFAGYGVQAPEYNWDDFKGIDVKGKTIIVLVNDPPVPDPANAQELDAKTFGGKAMTYYGRWTYKFEKAAELGAAGVLIVHEAYPAGYPWSVVQGMAGERFNLAAPDKNLGRSKVEGWMTMEAATALLKMAGQDYQKLKALAATPAFKAVPLGMTASLSVKQTMRSVDSQNVIGKLPGADPCSQERIRDLHRALGSLRPLRRDRRRRHLQRRPRQRERCRHHSRDRPQDGHGEARAQAHHAVPLRHRRRTGPSRLGVLRKLPALSAREDAGRDQHRRHQPVGQNQRPRGRGPGRLRSGRLRDRGGQGTGPHA